MMLDFTAHHTIPAALHMLPDRMDSHAARAMLLAIGLQESRFAHRKQVRGPARGFWQFESIGVEGVLDHPASRMLAREACDVMLYDPITHVVYDAIEHNDMLAACFARLALWRHPDPLPARHDAAGAWSYYVETWRPGKPHRHTWDDFYKQAWELLS